MLPHYFEIMMRLLLNTFYYCGKRVKLSIKASITYHYRYLLLIIVTYFNVN